MISKCIILKFIYPLKIYENYGIIYLWFLTIITIINHICIILFDDGAYISSASKFIIDSIGNNYSRWGISKSSEINDIKDKLRSSTVLFESLESYIKASTSLSYMVSSTGGSMFDVTSLASACSSESESVPDPFKA